VAGVRRQPRRGPAGLRPHHQAGAVRRLRPGGRRDLPEQVVTPGEELWVKIIDIDLQRRRISLSIKQAAEGGEVSEEYREAFGEHAYDEEGNYIGFDYAEGEFMPETEAQAAWADFAEELGTPVVVPESLAGAVPGEGAPAAEAAPVAEAADDAGAGEVAAPVAEAAPTGEAAPEA
jgi:small subunit ribosomal protein S1